MNMEDIATCSEFSDNVIHLVDIHKIDTFLTADEVVEDEVDIFNMTSLGNLLLVDGLASNNSYAEEDDKLHRLSLAYERLHSMPKILIQELAHVVKILDLSHNEFDNLDFLSEFKVLTTLICDHNNVTSNTSIPYMPQLELLWLNHCKIASLYPWAKKLKLSCPNLRYLSLMGNSVAPSYLNGGNFYEYLQYRLFMISLFPNLVHLDDKPVTADQKEEAHRMYQKPFVERLVLKTQSTLPEYLRHISDKVSGILTPTPTFAAPERNVII